MNVRVYFNNTLLVRSLLYICDADKFSDRPIIEDEKLLYVNGSSAVLSFREVAGGDDFPVRVVAGNIEPKSLDKVGSSTLSLSNGLLYVGDVEKESYMVLNFDKNELGLSIWSDNVNDPTLVYLKLDSNPRGLNEKLTLFETDEDLISSINQLGKDRGCHICGSKNKDKYIPHLLPPLEVEVWSERDWYPICEQDYQKYQAEIDEHLKQLIGLPTD